MERLTKKEGTSYTSDCGGAELAQRLGLYEDLLAHVLADQEALPGQLAPLRAAGKTHSYQFRELMGRKLNNTFVISLFQQFGLTDGFGK